MAKGYVIVDMPECCSECQLCTYDNIMGFDCHGAIDDEFGFVTIPDEIIYKDLKPEWCPIKQPPEFEAELGTYQENWLYVEGYSACFKDILGDDFDEFD